MVCPRGQLWAFRADSAAGPGSKVTKTFAPAPVVLRLQEKAQLGAELQQGVISTGPLLSSLAQRNGGVWVPSRCLEQWPVSVLGQLVQNAVGSHA